MRICILCFFFQAEDGIRDYKVTGVQTCALPICGDRADDTKHYEFGDPFLLDLKQTLMNAVERGGPGTPVRLVPDDFEVFRTRSEERRVGKEGRSRGSPDH